ncbi:acyl-CoA N-acyltransferase [Cylindrobasidium torrendii FP15055 ss-10]|uniref:Acyl-CoA N-acyltransferase n=1 Tax=Cylindrobasidium torrendii FP15055 ss-10 TaxID=1314674 RepID=A0A0D7B3J3_9AGAR|nr:acyl-CoA N-acyltransferase [Cylindrobasidium torrendii FP15055 ss-10]
MFLTTHLVLRAFDRRDIEPLRLLQNEHQTNVWTSPGWAIPDGEVPWEKKMNEVLSDPGRLIFLAIELRQTESEADLVTESAVKVEDLEPKDKVPIMGIVSLRMSPSIAKHRDASMGILIGEAFTGKGYGTEVMEWLVPYAFDHLGLHRVSLEVFGNNPRARRVYEKAGFVLEGTKRKALWAEGKWNDIHLMGIMDEDYHKERAKLHGAV